MQVISDLMKGFLLLLVPITMADLLDIFMHNIFLELVYSGLLVNCNSEPSNSDLMLNSELK